MIIKKRITSLLSVLALSAGCFASLGLAGCSSSDVITISIYDENSPDAGYLTGWFADEVRDKFNIQILYENANSSGFTAYVEADSLGDIVIFSSTSHYRLARNAGCLMEWNEEDLLSVYGSQLQEEQALSLSKNLQENDNEGIYGIYAGVTNTEDMYTDPACIYLNYEYYKALGCPAIANREELTTVLKDMVSLAQKDQEKTVYAISTTDDNDDAVPAIVEDLLSVYGYEVFGLGIYNPATDDYQELITENGFYSELLTYYHELYQEGLINPDSTIQTAEAAEADYDAGLALMSFTERDGFIPVAIGDATPNVYQVDPAGSGSIISIAANTTYPDYCMELIEWLYSADGYLTMNYGPKGTCWNYDANGNPQFTEFGYECLTDGENAAMTGTYSGFFADGFDQLFTDTWNFNAPIAGADDGVTFNYRTWPDSISRGYADADSTTQSATWQAAYGVTSTSEYLEGFTSNRLGPNSFVMAEMNTDINLPYAQVTSVIEIYSWSAITAESESELVSALEDMATKAKEYRYTVAEDFFEEQLALCRATFR